jgi:protein-disulfide isomerase
LTADYPTEVAVVFHHFPLNGHRFARAAALAGDCAAAQGRFAEMKEQLFARQDSSV